MKIILCQFGEEIKVSEFINIIQAQIQASNIKASATNIIFKKYEEAKETEEGTAKENDNLNTVSFDTETQELIIYTGIKADEDTDNIKALLEEALKNETDTRTEKDAELKESIENEINYRETKDNELREAINNEATARAEKDSELNKILDNSAKLDEANTFTNENNFTYLNLNTSKYEPEQVRKMKGVPQMLVRRVMAVGEANDTGILTSDIKSAVSSNEAIFTIDTAGKNIVLNAIATGDADLKVVFKNGYEWSLTFRVSDATRGENNPEILTAILGINHGQIIQTGTTLTVQSFIYWDKNNPNNANIVDCSGFALADLYVENAESGNSNCAIGYAWNNRNIEREINGVKYYSKETDFNLTCQKAGIYTLTAFYKEWFDNWYQVPTNNERMATSTLTFVVTDSGTDSEEYVFNDNSVINKAYLDNALTRMYDGIVEYESFKIPQQTLILSSSQDKEITVETDIAKDDFVFEYADADKSYIVIGDDGVWKMKFVNGSSQGAKVTIKHRIKQDTIAILYLNTSFNGSTQTAEQSYKTTKAFASKTDIGDKASLNTTAKDSLVSAINELKAEIEALKSS